MKFKHLLASIIHGLIPRSGRILVFSSFPDYTDNAYALYQYLSEELKEKYECIWLYSDKESLKRLPHVKGYYKYSIQAFYYFARARYVFCTHGIYDFLRMRRRDKIVNLWHGMPLKTIGCMDPLTGGKNPARAHYLIATSPLFKEIMHKSFENVDPDKVLLTGQPRNDLMFQETDFFSNRGIDRSAYTRIGIWLPTYRRSIIGDIRQDGLFNDNGISFLSMDDLAKLDAHLQHTSSLLIVKLHPMDALQQVNFSAFKNLWFNVRVNAGASTYYSEIAMVQTLDNLRRDGVLEVLDYLERIPDKLIPRRQELIESIRAREQKAEETEHPAEGLPAMGGSLDEDKLFGGLTGTVQARYDALPKVAQRALIGQAAK